MKSCKRLFAWLLCVLMIGLSVIPSMAQEETCEHLNTEQIEKEIIVRYLSAGDINHQKVYQVKKIADLYRMQTGA